MNYVSSKLLKQTSSILRRFARELHSYSIYMESTWYVLLDFKCSGLVITPDSLLQLCMNIEERLLQIRNTTRNTRYLQRYSCYLGTKLTRTCHVLVCSLNLIRLPKLEQRSCAEYSDAVRSAEVLKPSSPPSLATSVNDDLGLTLAEWHSPVNVWSVCVLQAVWLGSCWQP